MPWEKGQSGNKNGRPALNEKQKQNVAIFKKRLKEHSVVALDELINMMMTTTNQELKYKICTYILDKTYGKNFIAEQFDEKDDTININLIPVPSDRNIIYQDDTDEDWGMDDRYMC